MKVNIKGGGPVTLNTNHFIAKGGEGSVYGKGDLVYKVTEPGKMIPSDKIRELSILTHPDIIIPKDILLDSKNNEVGYTMRWVKDTCTLCELFTQTFKDDHHIDSDTIIGLVKKLQELVTHTHSKSILIVDLNELNFLVNNVYDRVFAIDVNSYQTKSYKATAIMESIRDIHSKTFNQETDWFSWGVVTCQMLTNIHPYKGTHPNYKGKSSVRFQARRQNNISIFDSSVTLPAVATIDTIPNTLKEWYKAIFQDGKRCLPPTNFEVSVPIIPKPTITQLQSTSFILTELLSVDEGEEIVGCRLYKKNYLILTKNFIYYNKEKFSRPNTKVEILFTHNNADPISVYCKNNILYIYNYRMKELISSPINFSYINTYNGRLFGIQGTTIAEITINKKLVSFKPVGNVLNIPHAIQVFPGMIVQNMLGRLYATPLDTLQPIPLDVLKDYKIIDGRYKNGLFVTIGHKDGRYDRFLIDKGGGYIKFEDITTAGINMNVSEGGVLVLINEEDKIEMARGTMNVKIAKDNLIDNSFRLFSCDFIAVIRGNKVFQLSTK